VRLEGLGQLKKIHLIGTRTRNLPACSIVPQPTTLPRAAFFLFFLYGQTIVIPSCLSLSVSQESSVQCLHTLLLLLFVRVHVLALYVSTG
jgi:hypothetical protein